MAEVIEVVGGSATLEVTQGSSTTVGLTAPAGPQGIQGVQGIQGPPGTTDFTQLQNVPATFPPSTHTHLSSDVTDFNSAAAAAAPVQSVAGRNGTVTLTKADVGLGNADNTSDLNKPISTATQTALDGKAAAVHTHIISSVTGLQSALDGKQAAGSYAPSSGIAPTAITGTAVITTDSRLSDARTPTAHTHPSSAITDFATAAAAAAPVQSVAGKTGSVALVKADVGLGNVDNTADTAKPVSTAQQTALNGKANISHTHAVADVTGLQTALDGKQASGSYATLVSGTVPAAQLPSYVDDVLEFANFAALPVTGETGKIYVTTNNNKVYRWSGSTYVEIIASPSSTDSVPEGSTNLYHTTARASAAAPVQSVAGRTGAVTLAVADVANAVSTSDSRLSDSRTPTAHAHSISDVTNLQTSLDGKAASSHSHTPSEVGLGNVANTAQVTSVTGTTPIVSSGGTTPAISISPATTSAAGSMSSADKVKLNGIASGAEVNVNADWNAASGDAQILNKPTSLTPTPHAASHFAEIKASYNGQVGGMTEDVLIRADIAGATGNSITLSFDGVDDIDTVLGAWNSANPSNQASLLSGDGAQVPDNNEEIALSGGGAGSDPFANINQNLGTTDSPQFLGVYVGAGAINSTTGGNVVIRSGSLALAMENPSGFQVSMRWKAPAVSDTGYEWAFGADTLNQNANNFFIWDFINNRPAFWANGNTGNIVLGGQYSEGDLQSKVQIIGIAESADTLLGLESQNAGAVPLVIRGAASQTANLTEWLDSNDNVIAYVDADGNFSGAGGGFGEVRFDASGSYTYTGQAAAGASESAAVWFIRRSEFSSAGSYVGTTTANNVEWDDRLTATYT